MTNDRIIRYINNYVVFPIKMVQLHIEMPDELHKKLKLHAIRKGTTLRQSIVDLLREST